MEEYFDIVDKNNNPTGEKKPRSEVHATGLWHRVVHVYFFRRRNQCLEFLVHLRAKTKDLNPDKWDTRFGGHVKVGETAEKTVIEEIKDEVGLDITYSGLIEGECLAKTDFPNREFIKNYYYEFQGNIDVLKFSDGEICKVKWMTITEIEKSMKNKPKRWAGNPKWFKEVADSLKTRLDLFEG